MIFLDNTLHAFQPIAVPEFIRLGRKQLLIRRERIAAAAVDQCDHDHICIMMPDIKFNGGAGNVLRCLQRIIQKIAKQRSNIMLGQKIGTAGTDIGDQSRIAATGLLLCAVKNRI